MSTATTHPDHQLLTQLQQTREAYINARVEALRAMDAENWARWKYQQAVNACINCGVDPQSPPF
jgi:hypothetical protein